MAARPRHKLGGQTSAPGEPSSGRELANQAVVAVEACDTAFFAALGNDIQVFTRALATPKRAAR